MAQTTPSQALDAAEAFRIFAESFGASAGAPEFAEVCGVRGADAAAKFELGKVFLEAAKPEPMGCAIVGFKDGKVASASFEPSQNLGGGRMGPEPYPLFAKEMQGLAEGFALWERDAPLVEKLLGGGALAERIRQRALDEEMAKLRVAPRLG